MTSMACRLPAWFDDPESYRAGAAAGCDGAVEIPYTRFHYTDYWNPDPEAVTLMQCSMRHMGFVEGIEYFDNKYFDIPDKEAMSMDPMQRQILEVGSSLLLKHGIDRKSMKKARHGSVSVGLDKDDWQFFQKDRPEAEGGNNVQAIIANRFSYIFNLKGPNYVADTACSASLIATHFGKMMLLNRGFDQLEFHAAFGIHQCLAPLQFIGFSQGAMGSHVGRCMTFDESAIGYMKAEGCSAMVLAYGDMPAERDGIMRGSMINQNGRSATLTAPNGPAQQEVITKAMREAGIEPDESTVWNCHGTGTSLGDPIELGTVKRVQTVDRSEPLMVSTNKTCMGHLEGGAAMTTLIAAVLQLKQSSCSPFVHFRVLNPHVDTADFVAFLNSELGTYGHQQGNTHVSSFGFGGTNGHAIFWGQNVYNTADAPKEILRRIKRMEPPEVRVLGSDPANWDWDFPDRPPLEHERYVLRLDAAQPVWDRVQREIDEPREESYAIAGNFNGWEPVPMQSQVTRGVHTFSLFVPAGGSAEFRFLQSGERPPLGPLEDRGPGLLGPESGTCLVLAEPGSLLEVCLFARGATHSVAWLQR